ncbi:HesA/MoeB/ThiF family protein [Halocynthiibacter styelae]|nr:HesA/MoeB/ThiF family protein [Paenihalocynthiibacter styelae]
MILFPYFSTMALIAAVLWGIGMLMKVSVRSRLILIGIVAGVRFIPIFFMLPLLLQTEFFLMELWGAAAFAVFAVLVVLYARWVRGLKAQRQPVKVETVEEPAQAVPAKPASLFAEGELERYARHIVLHDIGGPGQKALKQARVLVIGAGGLGSPALLYLAASGVGTIEIVDDDVVELSNLQRQVIHSEAGEGTLKVASAAERIRQINSHCNVIAHNMRLDDISAEPLISGVDLVLDGCDNFKTRYLVNEYCTRLGKPLISGALSQWEGQISVFDPASGTPCYRCVFPEAPAGDNAPTCATAGVLSPLPGVVGSMMVAEAVKLITGAGQALRGEMLIYDAKYAETRKIRLQKGYNCPVCGDQG